MTGEKTEQSTVDSLVTILSGGTLVSIGKIFGLAFGFFTQIAMARLLTEGAYGQVVLTMSIVGIVELVGKLGVDDGVTRKYPQYEDTPSKAYGVILSSLHISLVSGMILGSGLFLLAPLIARDIFSEPSLAPLLQISAVGIPFLTTKSIAADLVRGARDARVLAYVGQIFQPAVRLALVGCFLLIGYEAIGAITGQIFSLILGALATFYLAYKILPSFDIEPETMYRSLLTFSLPLIAVQGMGLVNSNVDIYMVGYFLDASELGIYNIALQLSNVVIAILGTAGFLLPPMLTRLQQRKKQAEMRRTFQILTKWISILILPIFVVLFFAPKLTIRLLFGESYVQGVLALQILLLGNLVAIFMGLNSQALIALGNNRIVSYIVFCQTTVNIIANYILIPVIGFEGAAIGMILSSIIGDFLGVGTLYRRHKIHPFTWHVLSPIAAVMSFGILAYSILTLFDLPTYWTVVLIGVIYLPIVAILAPEPEDEELLTRVEEQLDYNLNVVRRTVKLFRVF